MKWFYCLLVMGFLPFSIATAEDIELWSGMTVVNAEILGIKDGSLMYKADEQVQKIALTKVRTIKQASGACEIVRFVDYSHRKRPVKLLTISVKSPDEQRIRRPFVRVFTCQKDKRGVYEVTAYMNSRINDPTNAAELETVDATDYATRHYTFSKPDGLAFRVEIWRDGILNVAEDYGNVGGVLPKDWYRTLKVRSRKTLRLGEDIELEKKAVDTEEEAPEEPVEQGWGIDTVSVLPEVLTNVPRAKVDFSMLNPQQNVTTMPIVKFYYVSESTRGTKRINSITVSSKSGNSANLIDGRLKESVERKLPSNLRLTKLETQEKGGLEQLIYWRVELIREEKVLASKEKGGPIKSQLPDEWWK